LDNKELARIGARVALQEHIDGINRLVKIFPGIDGELYTHAKRLTAKLFAPPRSQNGHEGTQVNTHRPRMSAAGREAVSKRMRKYWAGKRAEKKQRQRSAR
jgi:hypothetical protein